MLMLGRVLVTGALINQRALADGRTYQVAGWAFMVSLLFGSLVGNVDEWLSVPDEGPTGLVSMTQGSYLASVGIMCLIATAGFVGSLMTGNGRGFSKT